MSEQEASVAKGKKEEEPDQVKTKGTEVESHTPIAEVINIDDMSIEETATDVGVLADVLGQDDNFKNPRRLLAETIFPDVDGALLKYSLTSRQSDLTYPMTVTKLPPCSVLEELEKDLTTSENAKSTPVAKISCYGVFDIEGIRLLKRFHRLKCLRREVSFEKKWLQSMFHNNRYQREVTEALLDRWNLDGAYLRSYDNYRITSQELSLLCGERYLSDELINFLGKKYCDKANEEGQIWQNVLLHHISQTALFLTALLRIYVIIMI